ncbi:AAA family ATPase [Jiangella mangrovi]|uniref:Cdc6-like AAA superfamily ATPase n=1 Tax=Jiangella mangrovi TaxID=1524084 RepID=A0A7W9GTF6_9ACTN|nr:AAA family ATPase [Jiangella mangrovi]MBB5789488.1 Cdc6-like AAA superfamily ATPase [Jiangella mangrovi]
MRLVLLGGAPGVGKTSVARQLLRRAAGGSALVQWVDVDALWWHQPWRVDERTTAMVRANLAAVMDHAATAGVQVLVVTWVFQSTHLHELVRSLAPPGALPTTVQLVVGETEWRRRFEADPDRPPIDDFFRDRYAGAQKTPSDHRIETDRRDVAGVAAELASLLQLT